jgi:hypothetical protein
VSGHAFRPRATDQICASEASTSPSGELWDEVGGFESAIRARDVRAADLQEEPTNRWRTEMTLRHSRFVGSDEDGGSPANIAASGASH